jgi:hypothetical protein
VVDKKSRRVFATAILATLGLFSLVTTLNIHNDAFGSELITMNSSSSTTTDTSATTTLDKFGVQEIYPTKDNREWYVNMGNPQSDPNFRNLNNVKFSQNTDGSWRVSASQIRMEAWSPENQKWNNIEMTEYAKIVSGSNELLQMYSRGGHHSSKDPCLGSAYKARLYGNGEAAWVKEVTHPAYAGNKGIAQATAEPLKEKWVGFKAVIYNVVGADGKTYVRLESYIDDSVTDSNGNLVIKNNWKLASVYEDKGGWATHDSDFDSQCGRARDAILTAAGGTSAQNIAAFRSDSLTWDFKYLSVREIDPAKQNQQQLLSPSPQEAQSPMGPAIVDTMNSTGPENNADSQVECLYNMTGCTTIASQHFPNEDKSVTTVTAVKLPLTKIGNNIADIDVVVSQEGRILGSGNFSTEQFQTYVDAQGIVSIYPSANVHGDSFDVTILTHGAPEIVFGGISVE